MLHRLNAMEIETDVTKQIKCRHAYMQWFVTQYIIGI